MESIERANIIIDAMNRAEPYTPDSIKLVRYQIEKLQPPKIYIESLDTREMKPKHPEQGS